MQERTRIAELSSTGLTAKEMMAVVVLVDGHVRSAAQISLGAAGTSDWADNFGRVLETVAGDPRYPTLSALVAAGGFEARAGDAHTFEFGLERLLDGVDAFIRARAVRRWRPKTVRRVRPPRSSKAG